MNTKKLVVRSLVLGILAFFGIPLIIFSNGYSIVISGSRVFANSLTHWVLLVAESVTLTLTLIWRKKL